MTAERGEMPLRILYQDDSCAVVDKPSGMIVHRGWANDDRDLLRVTHDALGRYVYPLHRLDRGASGAVLFALNEDAARVLNRSFAERSMDRQALPGADSRPPARARFDRSSDPPRAW